MPEYRVGDVIKITRTVRITAVGPIYLHGEDVQTGAQCNIRFGAGTRIEMVKRAPDMHSGPKPKAGTVLKGKDIKRIWWKRGTIFALDGDDMHAVVLKEDGRLYPLSNISNLSNESFAIEEFADYARFELRFVA